VLYDLGCGDARFLLAAHNSVPLDEGLKSVGVEYDEVYYKRAVTACQANPSISIRHADVLTIDLSPATAIFVYLVPAGLQLIAAALSDSLRNNNCKIVSYMFKVPGLTPVEQCSTKGGCKVYRYDRSSLNDGEGGA
jgi:hypothetical protein